MEYQFPEHWIPILGKRIKNVHFKEFTKKGTDHSLEAFPPAAGRHDQLAGRAWRRSTTSATTAT